jgi:prevent-host-death family protein
MQTALSTHFLDKMFVGTDYLRKSLTHIIQNLPDKKSEIVITQHGTPKAVLLDINTYLELTDAKEDVIEPEYIDSLYRELKMVKKSKRISHDKLIKKLKINV